MSDQGYKWISSSPLQEVKFFRCSLTSWSKNCFCGSFLVVALKSCIRATPRSAQSFMQAKWVRRIEASLKDCVSGQASTGMSRKPLSMLAVRKNYERCVSLQQSVEVSAVSVDHNPTWYSVPDGLFLQQSEALRRGQELQALGLVPWMSLHHLEASGTQLLIAIV